MSSVVGGSNRQTQRGLILRLLIDARGEWVPLPEILALGIAQYNARVFELRRLGFAIENRSETDPETGVRHSWFRLSSQSRFEQAHRKDLEREVPLFAGGAR